MKPDWYLIANATRARLPHKEQGCPRTHDLDLTSVGLVELDQRLVRESS